MHFGNSLMLSFVFVLSFTATANFQQFPIQSVSPCHALFRPKGFPDSPFLPLHIPNSPRAGFSPCHLWVLWCGIVGPVTRHHCDERLDDQSNSCIFSDQFYKADQALENGVWFEPRRKPTEPVSYLQGDPSCPGIQTGARMTWHRPSPIIQRYIKVCKS